MGFRVIQCINDQSIVTDAGLAQPAGEAPIQDWLASFAAQQNLQRLADTLGQRPLTPLGDVGVAGGFRVSMVKRACALTGGLSNLLSRPPSPFTRARASADKSHPRWRSTQTLTFSGLGFFEPSGLAQRLLSFSYRLARTWCCGRDSLGGGLRRKGGASERERAKRRSSARRERVSWSLQGQKYQSKVWLWD